MHNSSIHLFGKQLHLSDNPHTLDKSINTITTELQHTTNNPHTSTDTSRRAYHPTKRKKKVWSTFTYIGPETKFITKFFKHTDIKVAYKTNNTIRYLLSHQTQHQPTPSNTKYNKSGIYRLNCPACNMRYIGQTGRPFLTRYREHYRNYKHNNGTSKNAQNVLEHKHSIGSIHNTMEILHVMRKGKLMDTWEKFHVYQETKSGLQIKDKNTVTRNILFDAIIQKAFDRGPP